MLGTIGAFGGLVGGILTLDLGVIRSIQASPNGLGVAVAIVLLACLSDAVGNSPLLFIRRMTPTRLAISLLVATLLAAVRLSVWAVSFALVVSLVERRLLDPTRVASIVGLGYAPMLLSVLVVIPTLGPFIAKVLHAWVLVAITASIAVAGELTAREALGASLLAWVVILLLSRTSDPLVVGLLSRLSKRLLGADVMQRTRDLDVVGRTLARPGRRGSTAR
jgi:hypothetical protein